MARCVHYGRFFRNPPHPRVFAHKKFISHKTRFRFASGYEVLEGCSESFVKIDAEGAEINWLKNLSHDAQRNIQQMLIVVKDLHKDAQKKKAVLRKLNDTHFITHVQPIWAKGLEQHPDGFPIPKMMVLQYINQKWFEDYPSLNTESFPWKGDSVTKNFFRLEYPPYCRLSEDALTKTSTLTP